jgi:glycerophosphoryl diester phosphodiesterase|tara:strand:- start:10563 stop:11216 length:654 start_codon:yes stop_codon:yes gene_type:complete
MLSIAHRGFSHNFKDNSFEAFDAAIKNNFDMIELDIQLNKENEIVVFHDIHLNFKQINELTHQECRDNDILTLADFFHYINIKGKNIKIYLDIKGNVECVDVLYCFLSNNKNIINFNNLYIAAFNRNCISVLNEIKNEHNVKIGYITCSNYKENEYEKILEDLDFISVYWDVLDEKLIEYCKMNNKQVYSFTCKNYFILNYMKKFKLDGIITNFPIN